ncbi:MAG: Fe-S cluster assembly protein SufD [Rhodobacterales bacterium]|jgi:Fe-S cluster assembly protein SufD|nr:FeS assembly protein SufD [Rhodobacterales bacterium HTCC2255]MBT3954417.1 Fe-S cluster assembly protein SufD [Rhodobacterales bacterium]MCO4796110.1 Fe-S cluster assembly protein SufD [Amylibacter sp.]MBT4134529.1 Fe-S cluster assembly protein SufD [Rhodobacterales bacterium]MBT4323523.1 Fe-S cluster assembly protein SufD [Rhodobacterales bacterium]
MNSLIGKNEISDTLADFFIQPNGATWANNIRSEALVAFNDFGVPTKRDEYWKYTNPQKLTMIPTEPAALFSNDEPPMFESIDRVKIVFVDGILDLSQSDDLILEGATIETLVDATSKDIHWAKDLFGSLEKNGQKPVKRPLAALNTAMAAEGLVIRITDKCKKPLAIRYIHNSETSDALVHNIIKIESNAQFTLLESGAGAARFNSVLEVDVADNADFHHVRTQGRDHERKTVTHIFGRLGKESIFKSFTMTVNGTLTRNDAVLEFTGDNARATVAGATAGDGESFHHDDTVFITHDAVNCESRQVFKKVLRNGATGVFQGKILVKADAQKTDGYQISQGLLLDDNSNFLAKPELEIYADDVACSHGSTVGAIDEDAIFYLVSRGVPRKQAQDMLVLAFLAEAIDEIDSNDLADDINDRLAAWMNRR